MTQAAAGLHEPLRAHHLIARSLLRSCVRSIDQVVSRVSNRGKYRGCRNYKCVKSACSVRVHVKITTTYTAFTTVRVRDPDSECNTRVTTRSTTIKIHMTQHVSHYTPKDYIHTPACFAPGPGNLSSLSGTQTAGSERAPYTNNTVWVQTHFLMHHPHPQRKRTCAKEPNLR